VRQRAGEQTDSEDSVYLFDLTGKVAVVTGGTRGIGLMIARGLLQAGASVYVSSRKPEAGEAAVAELSAHGPVTSVPADLAREEECARLAAEVGRRDHAVHRPGADHVDEPGERQECYDQHLGPGEDDGER